MGDVVNVSWSDILRTEGVTCKGFGVMPKYPLLDRDLSLTAKTIYAYLCSYTGNGDTAYPGVDTIIAHLGLNRETYYIHFKQLTSQGYISVQKQVGASSRFAHNIYRIESNPKKFVDAQQNNVEGGTISGSLSFGGLKSAGYGLIPKAIMIDNRISTKAKGLYAYFASYTGAGKVAFPKLETILYHLKITTTSYYKYQKELIRTNYLQVVQRYVNGRRGVNDYYLVDKPNESSVAIAPEVVEQLPKIPYTEKQAVIKQTTEKQDTVKQTAAKQHVEKQPVEKPAAIINSSTINNLKNNSLSKINPINPLQATVPQQEDLLARREIDEMDSVQKEDFLKQQKAAKWRRILRTYYSQSREELKQDLEANLGYEEFELTGIPPNIASLNSLVEIILDAVCSKGDTIKISGEVLDKYEVAEVLFSLTIDHLNYVLDCVTNTSSNIKNIKAYYLKSLYEAPKSYELYELKMVNELDQAGYL